MKSEQVAQQTAAAESTEIAKKDAEEQLAATLDALELSNKKITELESLLSSRDEQMAELAQVCARNSALEDELSSTRTKLAETVGCIEKLSDECSQLKELEMTRSSSVDKMVCELQESLDGMKLQLSVAEDEKRSATSQLEHLQQLLNDSAEKYSGLAEAHTALQSDFDNMKQAFDQLKLDHLCSNDHTAAVVEERTMLKKTVETLTTQYDSILAEKQAMYEEVGDLKNFLHDSMVLCENMQAQESMHTADVDDECRMLKNTVENLTVQHDNVLAEKQAMCQEVADLRRSLQDSMEQYDQLKARENMLCRGVVDLNCAVLNKTLVSHVDDASLSSYSDIELQNLLSTLLSEVTGFQNKLELSAKRMEDECQLREKVESEMVLLVQEGSAMRNSMQSLREENERLLSACKQLESSQAELSVQCNTYSSQVVQLQMELEAAQTSTDNVEESEKTAICPNVTLLQTSIDDKDAEIERLHQEIRAYKLDIERLEQEREVHAVNQHSSQGLLLITCEKTDESRNCEYDDNVESQRQVSGADTLKSETVVDENLPSGTTMEVLNERRDELLEMKEKMAEWEAMMAMLQTERDEIQAELHKLEQQEKRIFGTIDEVLQCVPNSMKGRDLFPSNSDTITGDDGCDSEFWNKLALLKTVVDELVFEVDEMKEKVHHMTDEVKISEQRVSELEAERDSLKEEVKEISLLLQSLRESEDALKMREYKLITEVEQMKSSVSDAAEDLKDKDTLLEKLQVLSSDADKLNAETELLHMEVASKDQLLCDAKVLEETLQESLRIAEERIRNLELQLTSVESGYCAKIGELQAERDELLTRVSDLQKNSDALHQQSATVADDLQRKYNDKCSEATELYSTITTYCKQIDELNAEVELLHTEVASKGQLLSDAQVLEETLQESLRKAREELSTAESKYSAEVGELQAERDELSTRVSDLQKNSDALHQQSATEADDLQRKYNDKCSEATELHSTIGTYCKQIYELKEELKVKVSEKEELNAEHTKLAGALKDLELHLDQLRAETDDLNAVKSTLEQKLCSLQEESEQKVKLSESQISQLEVSLSTIQMDYTKMCERKSAVENELTDCTQKLELTSSRLSQADEQCRHQTAELLQVRTELDQLKEVCKTQADQKSSSHNIVENVQMSSSSSMEMTADSSTSQVCTVLYCIMLPVLTLFSSKLETVLFLRSYS